jgi:hypothetical protein
MMVYDRLDIWFLENYDMDKFLRLVNLKAF